MLVASIDLETTGLDYEKCQIIEVGVAIDDLALGKVLPLAEVPKFHCYVQRDTYVGSAFALSMHSKILARMDKKEEPYKYYWPGEAAGAMALFLKQFCGADDGKITVVGKNFASFDLAFLRQEKPFLKEVVPLFRYRIIDIGTLFLNPAIDEKLPATDECVRRADAMAEKLEGHPDQFNPGHKDWRRWFDVPKLVEHNALDDALQVLHILRCWWGSQTPR
jgi:oligoribonuclease (3'-5' exoribonuclease)